MSEKEKAGFVCKHLLQRVDQDPEALRTFVKILMKRQAEFRPVIRELGGGKYDASDFSHDSSDGYLPLRTPCKD